MTNLMLWTSAAPSSSTLRGMTTMPALCLATSPAAVSMLWCGSKSLNPTGTPTPRGLRDTLDFLWRLWTPPRGLASTCGMHCGTQETPLARWEQRPAGGEGMLCLAKPPPGSLRHQVPSITNCSIKLCIVKTILASERVAHFSSKG